MYDTHIQSKNDTLRACASLPPGKGPFAAAVRDRCTLAPEHANALLASLPPHKYRFVGGLDGSIRFEGSFGSLEGTYGELSNLLAVTGQPQYEPHLDIFVSVMTIYVGFINKSK
jgi:hypothetical protein